jgi:hypothetical protein
MPPRGREADRARAALLPAPSLRRPLPRSLRRRSLDGDRRVPRRHARGAGTRSTERLAVTSKPAPLARQPLGDLDLLEPFGALHGLSMSTRNERPPRWRAPSRGRQLLMRARRRSELRRGGGDGAWRRVSWRVMALRYRERASRVRSFRIGQLPAGARSPHAPTRGSLLAHLRSSHDRWASLAAARACNGTVQWPRLAVEDGRLSVRALELRLPRRAGSCRQTAENERRPHPPKERSGRAARPQRSMRAAAQRFRSTRPRAGCRAAARGSSGSCGATADRR